MEGGVIMDALLHRLEKFTGRLSRRLAKRRKEPARQAALKLEAEQRTERAREYELRQQKVERIIRPRVERRLRSAYPNYTDEEIQREMDIWERQRMPHKIMGHG